MSIRIILAWLLLCDSVHATATFWVNPTNGVGNDSNPGTYSQPWKSLTNIMHALVVGAGDTVILTNGQYYNLLPLINPKQNGTASQPITIIGESTNAIICGIDITGSYWTVENIGVGTTLVPEANNPLFQLNGSNCVASNIVFNFATSEGVLANEGRDQLSGTNNLLVNCQFINISNSTALNMSGLSNLVTGCLWSNAWDLKCIKNFGSWGIVSNNVFENLFYDGHGDHGDIIQSFGDSDTGIPIGLPVEYMSNFLFCNNLILNAPVGTQMFYETIDQSDGYGYFDGLFIINNIWVNCGNQGVSGFPHTYVNYNLFFYCAQNTGQPVRFCNVPASGSGNANLGIATNSQCIGNVFINCGDRLTNDEDGYIENDGPPGFIADYNLVDITNFGAIDLSYFSFTGPHTITGVNPGIVGLSEAGFVGPYVYTMTSSSPLIGAGVDLSTNFTYDFNDRTRLDPWTIGPIQYFSKMGITVGMPNSPVGIIITNGGAVGITVIR